MCVHVLRRGGATKKHLQRAAVEAACKDPAAYVLKPQREGGGNNFYGDGACAGVCSAQQAAAVALCARGVCDSLRPPTHTSDVKTQLETLSEDQRAAYVLMEVRCTRHARATHGVCATYLTTVCLLLLSVLLSLLPSGGSTAMWPLPAHFP